MVVDESFVHYAYNAKPERTQVIYTHSDTHSFVHTQTRLTNSLYGTQRVFTVHKEWWMMRNRKSERRAGGEREAQVLQLADVPNFSRPMSFNSKPMLWIEVSVSQARSNYKKDPAAL